MNEFFKSKLGKCFLYTLLCVGVFLSLTLAGMFISGLYSVFIWDVFGRFLLVFLSLVASGALIKLIEEK